MTSPVKLRVAGAWSGLVEVPSLSLWTAMDLRAEVGRLSGFDAGSINLICGGRTLRDEAADESHRRSLEELGVGANSKLLVVRNKHGASEELDSQQRRVERLVRLKAAADAMARRGGDNVFSPAGYDLHLENQNGEQLHFESEEDRRALTLGLMLHAKGRRLIQEAAYSDALEVLAMAEEAFSCCNKVHVEAVDNVALLELDTVWCLFMLREIARLATARDRLARARAGLARAHGANLERLRVLQGGFSPELAIYVRLELLEGVAAFHSRQLAAARSSLQSAQEKFDRLHVSDEALAQLAAMGFSTKEGRRALRVSGQDVGRAVEFVMEQRRLRAAREARDRQLGAERREQRAYGKTPSGKPVAIKKLNELSSLGYERPLAAEALRLSENDVGRALDALIDPQSEVLVRAKSKRKRVKVDDAKLATLVAMGYDADRARRALEACGNDQFQAAEKLISGEALPPSHANGATGSGAEQSPPIAIPGEGSHRRRQQEAEPGGAGSSGLQEGAADGAGSEQGHEEEGEGEEEDGEEEERDFEMEEEIAGEVSGDPLAEYDIDVQQEGAAIAEYLALLAAPQPAQ